MEDMREAQISVSDLTPFRGDFSRKNSRNKPDMSNPYRVISVRLRTAEYMEFEEQTVNANLTKNQALRIAARRIGGFLEIDAETRSLLTQISRRLNEISRSLIMLNRACTAGNTVDFGELAELRKAFGEEFVRLDAKIKVILNVSLRRRDGLALLKKMDTP